MTDFDACAARALDTASARGAAYADIRFEEDRSERIEVRNGAVATLSDGTSAGYGIPRALRWRVGLCRRAPTRVMPASIARPHVRSRSRGPERRSRRIVSGKHRPTATSIPTRRRSNGMPQACRSGNASRFFSMRNGRSMRRRRFASAARGSIYGTRARRFIARRDRASNRRCGNRVADDGARRIGRRRTRSQLSGRHRPFIKPADGKSWRRRVLRENAQRIGEEGIGAIDRPAMPVR